jgi:hypothetical protein
MDPETTLCVACKDKNYTRAHCRVTKKHHQAPWSTVFVVLSYDPNAVISNIADTGRKKMNRAKKRKVANNNEDDAEPAEDTGLVTDQSNNSETALAFFDNIPRSRSFLCSVSAIASSVEVRANIVRHDTILVSLLSYFATFHLCS